MSLPLAEHTFHRSVFGFPSLMVNTMWTSPVFWTSRAQLYCYNIILVGGLEHLDYFSIQLGMSSSQLTKSYFSEGYCRLKLPTSYAQEFYHAYHGHFKEPKHLDFCIHQALMCFGSLNETEYPWIQYLIPLDVII